MYAWEAIENTLNYIETHLKEELKIEALASIAGLSPFYFQRLFKRLVHIPVQEYIKQRRLSLACKALECEDVRITDIAAEYCFFDHAHFTRSFKKAFQMTPEEYRQHKPRLNVVDKPDIASYYILLDENVPLIVGGTLLEISRQTTIIPVAYLGYETSVTISQQTPVGEATGVDVPGQLWSQFHSNKHQWSDYIDINLTIGMSTSANTVNGTFSYFVGGKQIADLNEQNDLVKKEISIGDYIVCKIEAESFETLVTTGLNQAYQYLFGVWLKNHELLTEPFSIEKYYPKQEDAFLMEIWLKPICQ